MTPFIELVFDLLLKSDLGGIEREIIYNQYDESNWLKSDLGGIERHLT